MQAYHGWIGRNGVRSAVFLAVISLTWQNQAAAQFTKTAKRPGAKPATADDLQGDPAFNHYAQIIVQLELLANPATASLPIGVTSDKPGQMQIGGRVPNSRLRQYILGMAKRVSGLKIVDEMQSADVPRDTTTFPKAQLESLTTETLQSLFPEVATKIRVTVKDEGIVELNGSITSFEQKLLVTQAIKSQPGCKAVLSLVQVDVDSASGEVAVTEDRTRRLKANRLPSIPPAPLVDLAAAEPQVSVKELTSRKPLADDGPDGEILDRQLREDVRNQIDANAELAGIELQIEAHDGVVTISGQLKNRVQVEKVVDTASNAAGVKRVIAKCSPYSIQRSMMSPKSPGVKAEPVKEQPTKWSSYLPWNKNSEPKVDASAANSRGFRESIRKALKKRCEGRLEKITVNNTAHGLVIEGDVANARDRTFVLKQIDNTVELRSVSYDVALRMKDVK